MDTVVIRHSGGQMAFTDMVEAKVVLRDGQLIVGGIQKDGRAVSGSYDVSEEYTFNNFSSMKIYREPKQPSEELQELLEEVKETRERLDNVIQQITAML